MALHGAGPFVRPLHDLHEACLRDSSLEKWLGKAYRVTAVRLRCPGGVKAAALGF